MTGARVQTMLRKKATLAAFLGLHGPGFQKEGLRAIDAIFLRDGTLLQGRAVGWDSTSTSGKTSGERGLGFRRPRHPAFSLLDMLPRCPSSWSWPRGTQAPRHGTRLSSHTNIQHQPRRLPDTDTAFRVDDCSAQ